MKLHTELSSVERSGVINERVATIQMSAKAIDILSSGIYTDPELAVVRELSCNAYDAHVAAGRKDIPIEIHLPNSLEPWFHVRDYGTGLSHEDIMGDGTETNPGIYMTYFGSTKTESNDFIGALGLGTKSPLSYTNSFEVISRYNGKRRHYTVFKNEQGLPTTACLGEVDTDEMNGLEVRVTIQQEDFSKFADRTSRALRWFPVRPNVVGTPYFKFMEIPKENLSGEGWKVFPSAFSTDYSKMTAVQGNVAYKVDISKIGLSPSVRKVLETVHCVGFFEIGDLETAASREEIRYDERSKTALLAKIEQIHAGVLASVEAQINALGNAPQWDVFLTLNDITHNLFRHDYGLFKEFTRGTKNQHIKDFIQNDGQFKFDLLKGHEFVVFEKTKNYGNASIKRRDINQVIRPDHNVVVFYNDLPSGGIARAQEWVRTALSRNGRSNITAIVIRRKKEFVEDIINTGGGVAGSLFTKKAWTEADYVAELKTFVEQCGNIKLALTSVDAPIPARSKSYNKLSLPIFQYEGTTSSSKYNSSIVWKRVAPNLDAGGIYFNLLNGAHVSWVGPKGDLLSLSDNWGPSKVANNFSIAIGLINTYLNTKYTVNDIYGFGSQAIGKIKNNVKWINLFDILKKAVLGYEAAGNFFTRLDNTPTVLGIKTRLVYHPTNADVFIKGVRDLSSKSTFRNLVLPLIEDLQTYNKHKDILTFIRSVNLDLNLKMFDNKAPGYFTKDDFDEYPMLAFIDELQHSLPKDIKTLFNYIDLIDRS